MSDQQPTHYLAVIKASYDYDPQSEDEIAIKEDQLLFLIGRVDEDWWKVKIKSDAEDNVVGLVPAAYVEQAEHSSLVKILYDYDAAAPGEISAKEDEVMLAFTQEDDWLLVQAQDDDRAGYVPANYVETVSAEELPSPSHGVIVPPSPARPVSHYADPDDLVATTKVNADDIRTWPVSELDSKGKKKKKGTLGVGNGAIFFASESDKSGVQNWSIANVENVDIEKAKHVRVDIGGPSPSNLQFHAGSKDSAEAIISKIASSKALAAASSSRPSYDLTPTKTLQNENKKPSVHFSQAEPDIIPRRDDDDEYLSEDEGRGSQGAPTHPVPDHTALMPKEETGIVLYDFNADGDDELSVKEGERVIILEKDGEEWWKVRSNKGVEGVIPALYVETDGVSAPLPPSRSQAEVEAEAKAAQEAAEEAEAAREEKERLEREEKEKSRKKAEAQRRADEAAATAAAERKKRQEAAVKQAATQVMSLSTSTVSKDSRKSSSSNSSNSNPGRLSSDSKGPPPDQVRTWRDRSGQFWVDAAFLGFKEGKLRLHKVNGVIVEVPAEKMSKEDIRYVEKLMARQQAQREQAKAQGSSKDPDSVPLSEVKEILTSSRSSSSVMPKPTPQKKSPKIDWFDFFLQAGCDLDDCTRYANSFERDKIDETLLPDITESTMRSLGLREGDIIRVMKHIEKRKPSDNMQKTSVTTEAQIKKDEEIARDMQAKEYGSRSPAPSLFTGPGGVLKGRRGRPTPSKSMPSGVDLSAITSASEQIKRTSSPQTVSSPINSQPARSATPSTSTSTSAATTNGFGDNAWENRPSSTKPVAAAAVASPPPVSTPVALAPVVTIASPPPAASAPEPPTSASTATTAPSLASTTTNDIFDQLARLSELRKNTPSIQPLAVPALQPPVVTTATPINIAMRPNGMGMSPSPVPIGQMQNGLSVNGLMVAGSPSPGPLGNVPRGPFAPVPTNEGLLKPLVPLNTGFNNFIPTRPASTNAIGSIPAQHTGMSFSGQQLIPQHTVVPSNFMGGNPGVNVNSFGLPSQQPLMMAQPLISQPTGVFTANPGLPFQNAAPIGGSFPPQFTGLPNGFNGFQPNSMFSASGASPPALPVGMNSNQQNTNTSPANVFASMKSGTFANDDNLGSQTADKYNALRTGPIVPQSTGWGQQPYQGGYMGFQH